MADRKTPLFSEPAIGPEALKVFAHPLRTAMYNLLGEQGPSTATQLGRQLGESSGQTSYHLRQLEKHGFVEDDPDHASGRERWWRAVGFSIDGRQMLRDPATAPAARALLQSVIADRAEVLSRAMSRTEDEPGWEESEINDRITSDLTPDETHDLIVELQRVLAERIEAAKSRKEAGETAGRRTVRIYLDVLPLPLPDAPGTPDAPDVPDVPGAPDA